MLEILRRLAAQNDILLRSLHHLDLVTPCAQVPVLRERKMRAIDKNWPPSVQEYPTRVGQFLECVADMKDVGYSC